MRARAAGVRERIRAGLVASDTLVSYEQFEIKYHRGQSTCRPVKYLLKIDLLCFAGQPDVQAGHTKGGPMIRLSEVKVGPQY